MMEYTVDRFLNFEIEVWEALKNGDMKSDSNLLSESFLGVYDSGIADKADHFSQLENGPTIFSYDLMEAKNLVLPEDVVLLSYLAKLKRVNSVSGKAEKMYVSSIWSNLNGEWKNVFSQDTPINVSSAD